MSTLLPKRLLGRVLLGLAEQFPYLRPQLCRWGRRTQAPWFEGSVPEARSRLTGHRLKLASFSSNYLSFELFWRGLDYYEPLTTALAQMLARPAGLFIDAGANIGFYSLRMAAEHPELEIVAFEPHPRLHGLLRANVDANGFRHITAEQIALSDRDGIMPFYLNHSDMSSSLELGFDSHHAGMVSVEVTSLDSYLVRRGRVPDRFLLKVDVEGHEPSFFAGAEATLNRYRPDIIAEAAQAYPPRTLELLRRYGYGFHQVTDEGLKPCMAPAAYVREPFVFLNCLLTTRPAAELAWLSDRLRRHARSIDLRQTSKLADPRVVDRCRNLSEPVASRPLIRGWAGLPARLPDQRMR